MHTLAVIVRKWENLVPVVAGKSTRAGLDPQGRQTGAGAVPSCDSRPVTAMTQVGQLIRVREASTDAASDKPWSIRHTVGMVRHSSHRRAPQEKAVPV